MANWTQEAEEHLVTMVEERPALYDIRESLYTNKVVKADLWRQIENKLVISALGFIFQRNFSKSGGSLCALNTPGTRNFLPLGVEEHRGPAGSSGS
ncbi:ATPase inhibitor A, mitochondrial isoform X3 [Myripristis murdjan]|uniref:ATPase inhibitor A, mitochondrial isoform X3 n=1 Tax=Myripristis murdjan TaxID=586833 RepID=UPI001175F7F8|nr:ATPase inhibitor, mitochondrial isoform X3 [Myripristis murdjan]